MSYIKKLFRNFWALSIFCIVLGIALIMKPAFFTLLAGRIIGACLLTYGIVLVGRYMSKNNGEFSGDLAAGIIWTIIGVMILVQPFFISKIITIVFGIYMLISGIIKINENISIKNAGYSGWELGLILAILTTCMGGILLLNPLSLVGMSMFVVGIALLVAGVSNILGFLFVKKKMKNVNVSVGKSSNNEENQDFIDI